MTPDQLKAWGVLITWLGWATIAALLGLSVALLLGVVR